MKKTIITLLVVAAVVITVIIIALADSSRRIHQGNDNEWLKLKEIAAITDFFDASINKMILREGVTSPEWVVFDDVDLISDWNFFLIMPRSNRKARRWIITRIRSTGTEPPCL